MRDGNVHPQLVEVLPGLCVLPEVRGISHANGQSALLERLGNGAVGDPTVGQGDRPRVRAGTPSRILSVMGAQTPAERLVGLSSMHTSLCEGLIFNVGCACVCHAARETRSSLPDCMMRFAGRFRPEHVLSPAETGIGPAFAQAGQPYVSRLFPTMIGDSAHSNKASYASATGA